jgi:hypothetical protein
MWRLFLERASCSFRSQLGALSRFHSHFVLRLMQQVWCSRNLSRPECLGPGLLEPIESMFRSPHFTIVLEDSGLSKKPRKGGSISPQMRKRLLSNSC